jgi:hypothetical protein
VKRKPPKQRADAKDRAADGKARAKRAALRAGVDLSAWEGEFLGSVEERLETFGRAFGDPEKGAPGEALSALQTVKLKEIAAKAKNKPPSWPRNRRALEPLGRGRATKG